jgi:hypothetical protein
MTGSNHTFRLEKHNRELIFCDNRQAISPAMLVTEVLLANKWDRVLQVEAFSHAERVGGSPHEIRTGIACFRARATVVSAAEPAK